MSKLSDAGITWIICGQQTPVKASTKPRIEWVRKIVEAADKVNIPVFLKNNLKPLFENVEEPRWMVGWQNKPGELRQEFPDKEAK